MKKIKENNLQFAIVFFAMIFVIGIWADINLCRYVFLGEKQTNYEFENHDNDIQTKYTVIFPLKVNLIDINGLARKTLGQREMNGVLKLNNGYLTTTSEPLSEECITKNAQAIIEYSNYCKKHGITVLYAQPAYKISKWDNELPIGVTDGHNITIDSLLQKLNDGGVSTLDLRQCMYDDGINQYDLYYKTDHHWTTEGGFYTYQKISKWISNQTNTYLDNSLLDINNYQIDTYKNWHLGMRGQRTGSMFAGVDDYNLIYPKFETNIFNSSEGSVSNFKDAMINMDIFQNRNVQNRYTYDSAYAKTDINVLSSLDAKSNLNVLLLSDSFQQAIKPYFLLTYSTFRIDGYRNLSTSILETYKPDVVVIMTWPGYFTDDEQIFNFIDDATN